MSKAAVPLKFTDATIYCRKLATRIEDEHRIYRDDLEPALACFLFDDQILEFTCPCGCRRVCMVSIYREGQKKHGWLWDGNKEKPTLTPSIQMVGGCKWHGHITKGEFVPV